MDLTSAQKNRAAGVLLGQAIGDALGVPYEFGSAPLRGEAQMLGGGLGNYRPGEWSDDTQMAICIARATARGLDPLGEEVLDAAAQGFLEWYSDGPADIGNQTRAVLGRTSRIRGVAGRVMTEVSEEQARAGSAGNGALMRTGVVGLVAPDDPQRTALAAARFARLTHADRRCVESCIIWSEAVRVAVVHGRLDVRAGLVLLPEDRRREWVEYITDAEIQGPAAFTRNGFTVTALQAAWAAIHSTMDVQGPDHVRAALQAAIEIGHDTDTVAAIAGALLGARYGVAGLPTDLARRVQGWPYWTRGRDLIGLALATATGGAVSWPARGSLVTGQSVSLAIPHPDDDGVLLGTEADIARATDLGVTAVVSLSRINADDLTAAGTAAGNHVEVWLVDSEDPAANSHLAWTLADAAWTVRELRRQGERVLLHCVAAHHRTPAVALAYSRLLGADPTEAATRIEAALGRTVDGLLWRTAVKAT